MRTLLTFIPFALLSCSAPSQNQIGGSDLNELSLQAIKVMPQGGGYSGSDATKNKLPLACTVAPSGLHFSPKEARPSFCSGATYLVFLKALQAAQELPPAVTKLLVVRRDQKDGHGVFGRWNANGPGCAKLVADLDCGVNFTAWDKARAGDFLKIWWNDAIGGRERGHHVVYLSHDEETVRFWSSNQPSGYGAKSAPRRDCKRVLFSRITAPQKINRVLSLPPHDPWLERMLHDDFSWEEVLRKCRVRD